MYKQHNRQMQRPNLSPLMMIETRPFRRSKSESLMRNLTSTSYSHALLSNLAVLVARGMGIVDEEELNPFAEKLREIERGLTLYDFIRCIELIRVVDAPIQLNGKRLKLDTVGNEIVDNGRNHELVNAVEVPVTDGERMSESAALTVAEIILTANYRSLANGPDKRTDPKLTRWNRSEKSIDLGSGKQHKLSDLKTTIVAEQIDFEKACAVVAESLVRNSFHILLTQDRVILKDRDIHLMPITQGREPR